VKFCSDIHNTVILQFWKFQNFWFNISEIINRRSEFSQNFDISVRFFDQNFWNIKLKILKFLDMLDNSIRYIWTKIYNFRFPFEFFISAWIPFTKQVLLNISYYKFSKKNFFLIFFSFFIKINSITNQTSIYESIFIL